MTGRRAEIAGFEASIVAEEAIFDVDSAYAGRWVGIVRFLPWAEFGTQSAALEGNMLVEKDKMPLIPRRQLVQPECQAEDRWGEPGCCIGIAVVQWRI